MIGHISDKETYILKDVRLLYFVPMDLQTTPDKQIVLFRILERGPVKRRCSEIDVNDEPPNKRFKFDNTRSVIVMRAHVEKDEPLHPEYDQSVFIQQLGIDLMDSSSSETETLSEFGADILELDDYESSLGSELDFSSNFEPGFQDTETLMEFHEDFLTLRSTDGSVSQLFWVSSPYPEIIEEDEYQILDLSMPPRKFFRLCFPPLFPLSF